MDAYEKVEIARNPKRKTSLDYIEKIFDELLEIGMLCDVKETYEKLLNYFKNIDYDGYEFYKNEYISQYESDLEESYSL